MNNQAIETYLNRLWKIYRENTPGDFSHYIPALTELLKAELHEPEQISKTTQNQNYTGRYFIEARETGARKKNQKHADLPQFPRIRIGTGRYNIIGYLEPMNPGNRRIDPRLHPMGEVYREVFTNIVFTNFFIFLYYRDKKRVDFARPFPAAFIKELTREDLVEKKPGQLFKILKNFMNAAVNEEKISSWTEFQGRLALKTFYLRRYVILPFVRKTLKESFPGKNNPTVNLYNEYCRYFPFPLTENDFASVISHEIIDGIIRAGILCSGYKLIPTISIETFILEYRDKKSSGNSLYGWLFNVDNRLPLEVKWALDDLVGFLLYRVDFEKLGISTKSPWRLDGEELQWEEYFIAPYYDSPTERRRIKNFLQLRGIFSSLEKSDSQ